MGRPVIFFPHGPLKHYSGAAAATCQPGSSQIPILVHWKRLPSPAHPDAVWYDMGGSFDGSAAILPGKGPVILADAIGPPFVPGNCTEVPQRCPTHPGHTWCRSNRTAGQCGEPPVAQCPPCPPRTAASPVLRDNPGCQGVSWPVDLNDPELTHWRKDARNLLNITNVPCGSRVKNSAGAFPGGIFQNGDHWHYRYLSFGYRFTSTDPTLHEWRRVEQPFLSDAYCDRSQSVHCPSSAFKDAGGQWTLCVPSTVGGAPPLPPGSPTHTWSRAEEATSSVWGCMT